MTVPAVVAGEAPADDRADVIIARCPPMQEVVKAVGRVADKDVTVLLSGATGTGKEVIARALYHASSPAGDEPFLAVNCAALPARACWKVNYSGTSRELSPGPTAPAGRFEEADGGTLFLDEIGDMTPQTQSKVLRVLQEQGLRAPGRLQRAQSRPTCVWSRRRTPHLESADPPRAVSARTSTTA